MNFRMQAHVTYKTRYHIVWIPKYRKKILVSGVDHYFEEVMDTYIYERYPDVIVHERSVQPDHVHCLLEIPPKYSISRVIGDIKANTSREMRKHFDYLRKRDEMWSVGYFVSTVGLNESMIRYYIQNQEQQDKGRAELAFPEDTTGEA
jgi:putative transposase